MVGEKCLDKQWEKCGGGWLVTYFSVWTYKKKREKEDNLVSVDKVKMRKVKQIMEGVVL